MWAMALPPSTWATSGGMPDITFEDLENERIGRLPSQIIENLHSMGKEDPLLACDSFYNFRTEVGYPL